MTSTITSAANGLNLTGLGLYDSANHSLLQGAPVLTGKDDKVDLSFANLAAGSITSRSAATSFRGARAPPSAAMVAGVVCAEPASYGMLLGGLGLLGFLARRRQKAAWHRIALFPHFYLCGQPVLPLFPW